MLGYDAKRNVTVFDINEFAGRRMKDILAKLRPISSEEAIGPNFHSSFPAGFEVPHNHPALIAKGKNALVFRLENVFEEWDWTKSVGNKPVNLVAKAFPYSKLGEDSYLLCARPSGLSEGSLGTTVSTLRNLGLDIQDATEMSVEMHGIRRFFTIAPDLTDRGNCIVADAEEIDFGSLANGETLGREYDQMWRSIVDYIHTRRIKIKLAGHGTTVDPSEAVRHMFLVQYKKGEEGKLVIGDLNHLTLSNL